MPLAFYKFQDGVNKNPEVRVSLYQSELDFENPLQFVEQAGIAFENATVHDIYLYNDDLDAYYQDVKVLTTDQDTTDGVFEIDWIEFRVLISSTWSDWATVLSIGASEKLHYYASATGDLRDFFHIQARASIPYNEQSQLKDDIVTTIQFSSDVVLAGDGRPV